MFARNGERFQVFYVTPDGQAVVGGVMWDAGGSNLRRKQVEGIPGTIPTVTIGSVPATAQGAPAASLIKAAEGTTYGLAGNAAAPRLWMFIDPQCSFSVRAMQQLQPFVASGRVQPAIVPVSILDHEDGGLSRAERVTRSVQLAAHRRECARHPAARRRDRGGASAGRPAHRGNARPPDRPEAMAHGFGFSIAEVERRLRDKRRTAAVWTFPLLHPASASNRTAVLICMSVS